MRELQKRVLDWVRLRIGPEHAHPAERAMRLFEEATELLQAEGVPGELALRQVYYTYGRPAGDPIGEASAAAICLLAYCEARGVGLDAIALHEIERIEAFPPDQIRQRFAVKLHAELVAIPPRCLHERLNEDGICRACGADCRGV